MDHDQELMPSTDEHYEDREDESHPEQDDEEYRHMLSNRGGRGGFRNRAEFGPPRGMPPGHGPPRFRGRGFGMRGPPGFRGPPPPHFGGPPGPRGPRYRGPPPFDPNWGPMPPGMHPHHMMGPPQGMPPHMMGPMGMPSGPYGPPMGPPNQQQQSPNGSAPGGGGGPGSSGGGPGGPGAGSAPGGGNNGSGPSASNANATGGPAGQNAQGGQPGAGGGPVSSGGPGNGGGPNGPTGGTTNGPPPNMGPGGGGPGTGMDLSGDIWVETRTGEGKSYFYNARTRDTTWTKPEGPNVKIITQEQVEVMAQAAGVNQGSGIQQQPPDILGAQVGHGGAGGMPGPPGMMQGPPPGMPPQFGGPPPPHFAPGGPPPPFGLPPPGFQGGFPPPFSAPPGHWGMPGQPPPTISAPPTGDDDSRIDPELIARAAEWTEHKAPDGRSYFYNAKAGESVWEKPQALRDLETARLAAAQGVTLVPPGSSPAQLAIPGTGTSNHESSELGPNEVEKNPAAVAAAAAAAVVAAKLNGNSSSSERPESMGSSGKSVQEDSKMETDDEECKKKQEEEDDKAKEIQKVQDKSRPVSSTPVPGTPWCVVWTGDGRVFFYNPSTRTSVWERPEDLAGRQDVDKMVSSPPEVLTNSSNNPLAPKKRLEGSDDDSDATPAKRKKEEIKEEGKENAKPDKKTIDIGKEAAMEAEVRAARERAVVPLDIRIKSFKEMLAEKEVSAFSTWEKELHKIVFDPRYLLLTSKERKQVFEKYVKERAEEERREKRNKMRERKEEFRRLMEEAILHGKSSFSDFALKHGKDERFKNIEKLRERESLFNEYLLDVRKREKEEKQAKREQVKRDFISMLKEHSEIDRHARWTEVKKKLDNDSRYKAVDSSTQREDWFREFVKQLKEERKKEKEKDRERRSDRSERERSEKDKSTPSGGGGGGGGGHTGEKDRRKEKKEKDREKEREKDREREKEKEKDKDRDKDREEKDKVREKSSVNDEGDHLSVHNTSAANSSGHERGESVGAEERSASADEREKELKDKEKQARVEASIREREKEVQRTLATHLRDRDKEREQHKHDEAVQHFNALLADLVRNAELGWREAKRQLRKDHRWELAELLERDEKEKLFNQHIEVLAKKKKEKFRELLDETGEVKLTSSWKEIKRLIKEDPRYNKFSSSDRKCEREFKEYIKDKLVAAKADFRELLQETKLINHKSFKFTQENEQHLSEIEDILRKDKRYLVLDYMPDERTKLIIGYLEDLDKRGPPPPPTASEPTRRPTK